WAFTSTVANGSTIPTVFTWIGTDSSTACPIAAGTGGKPPADPDCACCEAQPVERDRNRRTKMQDFIVCTHGSVAKKWECGLPQCRLGRRGKRNTRKTRCARRG